MSYDGRGTGVQDFRPANLETREPDMRTAIARIVSRLLCTVFTVATLVVAGCGPGNVRPSDLTPRERSIKLYDPGTLPECTLYEEYGQVTAESGTSFTPGTYESSAARIRQLAAERGATAVILQSHNKQGDIDRLVGTAIKCMPRTGG